MATQLPVGRAEMIDVGGRRLNVWRAGDSGPTVVLLHGIPTNHLLWHDVVPQLAPVARVLAIDMLGYGWSDRPDGWRVDIASQAGYVLRVLDRLDIDRFTFVGHDLGGGVGQFLAVTNPGRTERLLVIDGVAFDGWPVPVAKAMKALWPAIRYLPSQPVAASLRRLLAGLFVQPDRAELFTPRFAQPWTSAQSAAVLSQHLRALDSVYTEAMAPFLSGLAMPVQVLWGRGDSQMKPAYGRLLAEHIPTAGFEWVDHSGHFVPAEAPSAVVTAVQDLLQRAAAPPPP